MRIASSIATAALRASATAALRVTAAAALLAAATAAPAQAGILLNLLALQQPDGQGDQAIFYYDAREGFTTFLNVRNVGTAGDLSVRVVFYTGGFSVPHVEDFALPAGALRIVDVGALRGEGLAAQPGVALAYAIDGSGFPVVSRALTGNFTVANLATNSAWGAPAAARSAVQPLIMKLPAEGPSGGGFVSPFLVPPVGTVIDGTTTVFQPIQPTVLDLATYYDPEDLAPVAQSGNQLIFVSFLDLPGASYSATPASTTWTLFGFRSDGTPLDTTSFGASGVNVTDLASVLGSGVNGAAGSIRFEATPSLDAITRLVYFAEALGTFGTGYLLPVPTVPQEPIL